MELTTSRQQFQSLIEPLLDQSFRFALSLLGHPDDAEDAVQDALLKGFGSFESYDFERAFRPWWFRIVRNCCINKVRERQRQPTQLAAGAGHEIAARKTDVERWHEFAEALAQLSPKRREILEYRYVCGLTYREIAEILNIPPGTVMSRLHGARQALQALFSSR